MNKTTYLSETEIRQKAPSVFQTNAVPFASTKYKQITTSTMIDALQELNWFPVDVQEVKARKSHTKGFQKHLVKFENPDLNVSKEVREVGDILNPQILLSNSHNTFNSFLFRFGLYVLACSNGLVIPHSEFGKFRVLHKGQISIEEVKQGVVEYVQNVGPVVHKINHYRRVNLSENQKHGFAKKALEARYGDVQKSPVEIAEIITPRREEDNNNSLWSIFNTIQENLMYPDRHNIHAPAGMKKRVKGIKGIDSSIHLNQALWMIMVHYASI